MTAPHPAASQVDPVLAVALVRAEASPAVVAAAAQRLRDWHAAMECLHRTVAQHRRLYPSVRTSAPEAHPAPEQAARAIVAACQDAERRGLLERPCRGVPA